VKIGEEPAERILRHVDGEDAVRLIHIVYDITGQDAFPVSHGMSREKR